MARLADAGRPVTSWARITGGTTGAPSFGVVLLTRMWDQPDEPWPFPITMPAESYATVRGTDDRQALLRGHLGRKTETYVGVTLREGPGDASPVRSAPTIVVACDGVVIGALTATESAARLPLLRRLTETGKPWHAAARIKRSTGSKGGLICSVATPAPR
jgi:hypothetical protein